MKQIKSSKNQPRWTKTMSILSLSVALHTQACATHRKLNMLPDQNLGNPDTSSSKDTQTSTTEHDHTRHLPIRSFIDPECREQCEKELSRLGLRQEIDKLEVDFYTPRDDKRNTILHIAARSKRPMIFELFLMKLLKQEKALNRGSSRIRDILLKKNSSGHSVLTVAALPVKNTKGHSVLTVAALPVKNTKGYSVLKGAVKRAKEMLVAAPPSVKRFEHVFNCIKCYLETEDKEQIRKELLVLENNSLLQSSYVCELMRILEQNTAGEIGKPTLVSASTHAVYNVVGKELVCNAVSSVLSQLSKNPGTFQQQILKKKEALKSKRANAGFSSEKDHQSCEFTRTLSGRRQAYGNDSDRSSSRSSDDSFTSESDSE